MQNGKILRKGDVFVNWLTKFLLWIDSLFPYEDNRKCYVVTVSRTVPDQKFEDPKFVEEYLVFATAYYEAVSRAIEESFIYSSDPQSYYYKNDIEKISYMRQKSKQDRIWMEGLRSKDNIFLNLREIRVAE